MLCPSTPLHVCSAVAQGVSSFSPVLQRNTAYVHSYRPTKCDFSTVQCPTCMLIVCFTTDVHYSLRIMFLVIVQSQHHSLSSGTETALSPCYKTSAKNYDCCRNLYIYDFIINGPSKFTYMRYRSHQNTYDSSYYMIPVDFVVTCSLSNARSDENV